MHSKQLLIKRSNEHMYDVLFSKKFLIPAFVISVLYIAAVTYLMNFSLVKDAIFGDYSLLYRVKLLVALLGGMWTAMNGSALIILFLTAILTGANLTLLAQRLSFLGKTGGNLMVGGSTLLAITASGCASCGLPVLALLGLSGSVLYLPLRGLELSYIAIFLLLISFYFQLKNDFRTQACRIDKRK